MSNKEKFEGMKRGLVENNERKYGAEARDRWGNAAAEDANRKILKLSKAQFDRFQSLEREISSALEAAVQAAADPAGEEGRRMYELHREWLGFTWIFYTPEAHCGWQKCTLRTSVSPRTTTATLQGAPHGCAMRLWPTPSNPSGERKTTRLRSHHTDRRDSRCGALFQHRRD